MWKKSDIELAVALFVLRTLVFSAKSETWGNPQRGESAINTIKTADASPAMAAAEEIAKESFKFTSKNGGTSIRVRGGKR